MVKNCKSCNDPNALTGTQIAPTVRYANAFAVPSQYAGQYVTRNTAMATTDSCTGQTTVNVPYIQSAQEASFNPNVAIAVDSNGNTVQLVRSSRTEGACRKPRAPCQVKHCPVTKQPECNYYGARREDCSPATPKPYGYTLFADPLDNMDIGQCESNTWNYFTNGADFTADDGRIRSRADGTTLGTKQFTKKYPESDAEVPSSSGWLDHFKTYAIANNTFKVPDCGELYVESQMSFKQYNVDNAQAYFGANVINPLADMRLSHGGLTMIDFETGLHAAVLHTNSCIYAHYEILPLDRETGDDDKGQMSHASAHLISGRDHTDPLKDIRRVGIGYSKKQGLTYYIADVARQNIVDIGTQASPSDGLYQYEGAPRGLISDQLHVGLLVGTMMDAVQPNNGGRLDDAANALIQLTPYNYRRPWEPTVVDGVAFQAGPENRLFGQGGELKASNFFVVNRC